MQPKLYKIRVIEDKEISKVTIFDSKDNHALDWEKNNERYYLLGVIDYVIEEDFEYIKQQLQNIINSYINNPACPIDQGTVQEFIRFFSLGYELSAKHRGDYQEK